MELDSSKHFIEEEHNLPIPYGITTKSKEIIVIKPQRARKRRHSKKHKLESNANKRRRSSILTKRPFQNLDLTGFHHLPNIGPNSLTVLLGEALIQYFEEHEGSLTDTEEANHNENQQDLHSNSSPPKHKIIDGEVNEEPSQLIDEEINQESSQVPVESENNNHSSNNLSPAPSRPLKRSNPSTSVPEKVEPETKPQKVPKKKKKRRSSDSSNTSKPKPIKFENPPENELDDEWLHFTESEHSLAEPHFEELLHEGNSKHGEGESKSDVMMKEMSLFFKILRWTGRMPFEMRRHIDFTFFTENRRGWNNRMYCLTTVIMTLFLTVMLSNFIAIFIQNGITSYHEIELLEFDKYWSFALFTLFNLWYVVISSLFTIFQGSFHLRQYMTRWNVCCNLLNFDTSYQLQSITRRELYFITFYGLLLIAGMIADSLFSDLNGCFGFLSTLLLRRWIRRFRVSSHYGWLRWVGVLIHFYTICTSRLMSATIILYCRALENAARRFNFRLVCMLGNVGQVKEDGKVTILRRMIPYKMLLAEHLVITTFSRNIGHVFSVCLTTFVITKAFAIIISAYTLILFINGGLTTDTGHGNYNHSGIASFEQRKLSVPIQYHSSMGTAILVVGVITLFSWGTFWYTTECIRDAGAAVLTMQSSFNPKNDYFINGINRQYIFGFVALLFSYSAMLLGFSIQRLTNKEIFICGENGQCIQATYNPRTPGLALSRSSSSSDGGDEVELLESAIKKAINKDKAYANEALIPKRPFPTSTPKRVPTSASIPVPTSVPKRVTVPAPVPTSAPKRVPTSAPIPVPTSVPKRVTVQAPVPTSVPKRVTVPAPVPTSAPKRVPTSAPIPAPTSAPKRVTVPVPVPTSATKRIPTSVPKPSKSPDPVASTTPPEPPPPEPPFEWEKFIKDHFYQCDAYPGKGKFLRLRMYFITDPKDGKNKAVYDSKVSHDSAKNKTWCEQNYTPWDSKNTKLLSDADIKEIKAENNNWKKLCYGSHDILKDDCGNIGISLPDKKGNLKPPKLELVQIKLIPDNSTMTQALPKSLLKNKIYWYCCYKWEGYENQQCGLTYEALVKQTKGKLPEIMSQETYVKGICRQPVKAKGDKCGNPPVQNSYHCEGFNSI
ncbi:unnamed protein product [Orchesella dallaii]|uniref:Uncharacterized protein n=1 Tax=Orchesella dallaii TaxID=48710 RepID=A0ABP1Q1C8_9HEXA